MWNNQVEFQKEKEKDKINQENMHTQGTWIISYLQQHVFPKNKEYFKRLVQ